MDKAYIRIGSFRISAVPTAGQNLLVQLGPMSDGEFIATNITYSTAPADVSAAALAVVNAVSILAPESFHIGHIGDGVVSYTTHDESVGFACTMSGNVTRVQHSERFLELPDSVRYAGVVERSVNVPDPTATLLGAGIGFALGRTLGGQ